jgi:hypothetical protein
VNGQLQGPDHVIPGKKAPAPLFVGLLAGLGAVEERNISCSCWESNHDSRLPSQ